ncbi:putative ATP-dependent zinc metalloprotease FtsH [Halenospora varia]|nr:putative ATP-dependent zinc metalloprotease FtsH [Halenospora varia]
MPPPSTPEPGDNAEVKPTLVEGDSTTPSAPATDDKTSMALVPHVPTKASTKGMKCKAIDFYPDKDGEWTQKYPFHIQEASENDETAEYAILKRNMKSSDTRKKLSLHSVVVQSPLIKKVLGKVFKGYAGITTELDRLEFETPFEPFVHRWERLRTARNEEPDLETREHLDLLWDVLEEELRMTLDRVQDLISHGVMTYSKLWVLFEPGTVVFTKIGNVERVLRTESYYYSSCPSRFNLYSKFVEWNGEEFGMERDSSSISSFTGTKKITDLSFYPLAYHPETTQVQERCIARGRLWKSHCCYGFKAYKGIGVSTMGRRFNVDSRVIVDTAAFNAFNPNSMVSTWLLENDDTYVSPLVDDIPEEETTLTPFQLLLACNILRGYSLKDKKWMELQLANIHEITWNDRAFTSLVLPNDTKDLVLAFAQSQIQRTQEFDDIIEGKGKGIIMLLSGPPGVGKTLTAEAVAESMRVPLYMMSAGDLGTEPTEVEESLSQILAMTTKWKAVLLLDEADVFLEARSKHDLERNKLVSIFLRILEYFEGFLFLTSNRVEDIDAAFESRIHLSLQYGALSVDARKKVWMTFLKSSEKNELFTEEEIGRLAEIELNGRQIKNILKTAQLLATSKNKPLSFEYVQIITRLRAAHACIPLKST